MPFHLPADVDLSSDQMKLCLEWFQAIESMNPDNLAKHVHDDFRRVVHPKSISLPAQNKDEWLKEMRAFLGFATGVEMTIHCIIEAEGKVVAHSTSEMKNTLGLDTTHETIAIAHIAPDKDGSLKIKQIENFFDTQVFLKFSQAVPTAMAAALAAAQAK